MIEKKFHSGEPKRCLHSLLTILLATGLMFSSWSARSEEQPPTPAPPDAVGQPADAEAQPSLPPPDESSMGEVMRYLWHVYRRSSAKLDSHGDFTWKDVAAASRLNLSLPQYVIGGMDPDFREQLFHMGKALDAAGIDWTILSAFRDDYRQNLAVGLKAHAGNSFHGGSSATGGYGHGCAVDIAGTDRLSNEIVWEWLGHHSEEFGLSRPLPRVDPAHVQAHGPWRALAAATRNNRIQERPQDGPTDTAEGDVAKPVVPASDEQSSPIGLTYEQYSCTRSAMASLPTHAGALHLSSLRLATRIVAGRKGGAESKWKPTGRFAIRRPTARHAART